MRKNIVYRSSLIGYRFTFVVCCLLLMGPRLLAANAPLTDRYDKAHPLVIVGDWDKPPYEFLNDKGQPAGSNVDLMQALCKELDIPCKFLLKEWSGALKTFERGNADIILANGRRYRSGKYVCSENIINYNRICAATATKDSVGVISTQMLVEKGVVLKPGDYSGFFFRNLDSLQAQRVEYQSPKVALQGLAAGDYHYFCWGEEPLKWKIKELNLDGIVLCDVSIPVSEIHIVGHDRDLIYTLDDIYSRMKQRGEVQRINDKWMHPERYSEPSSSHFLYIALGILLLGVVLYGLNRMARAHVRNATRNSRELNSMMLKALHMGSFHILQYDIKRDLMSNGYGTPILPEKGITLQEFIDHIHPQEQEEFTHKMNALLSGRERKFELKKRLRTFTASVSASPASAPVSPKFVSGGSPAGAAADHWLNLEGHAIVELDSDGQPAFVINALSDVTSSMEQNMAEHDLVCKYEKLSNMPFVAMSFYDKDGYLIDLNDAMRTVCGITPDNPETSRYWLNVCMFDIPMFRSAYAPGSRHELLACMHMDYPEMGINRYVEYYILPLFNADGQLANYYCSTLDVTDEQQRDSELRRLEHDIAQTQTRIERFESWLNFLTKQGNTYLWHSEVANQTAYFYRSLGGGTSPTDNIVMPFEVHTAHMLPEDRTQALLYFNSKKPFDSIQHFTDTVTDAGESWFRITGLPVYDAGGHFVGHKGLSIDISETMNARKRLEEETRIANDIGRMKSGFMASMTHELRTPLNAINGFSSVLEVVDLPAERSEYIRIIQDNCDMLERLINDILSASSLNEGPTSIQPADVDFAEAFDDICLTLRQRVEQGTTAAGAAGAVLPSAAQGEDGQERPVVQFLKEAPYTNFFTTIDIARVNQMITNFVTNAVKFTREGHIKLGYQYKDHGLRVYCEDTGSGIPKEKQEIIFDRFVKLDEFVQGTGMGLNICKSIAERMGGHIGVKSDGPGTGSTFWFWIPCERKLKV